MDILTSKPGAGLNQEREIMKERKDYKMTLDATLNNQEASCQPPPS